MENQEPLYIIEADGRITEINPVIGVDDSCKRNNPSYQAALHLLAAEYPERVISREDYDRKLAEEIPKNARKNFEPYKPMFDALKKYSELTPRQLSGITEMTEKKSKEFLERFHRADLVGKKGETYTLSPENEKEISKLFCLADK